MTLREIAELAKNNLLKPTTVSRGSSVLGLNRIPDTRGQLASIKNSIGKISDANSYDIQEGKEYNFNASTQNVARGGNVNANFQNLILKPSQGKYWQYAIIRNKVNDDILPTFNAYYGLDIKGSLQEQQQAINSRLQGISNHLNGLKIAYENKSISIVQEKEISEVITRTLLSIASSNKTREIAVTPISIVGDIGTALISVNDSKDQAKYLRLLAAIKSDAILLENEAKNLMGSQILETEKESLQSNLDNVERKANTSNNDIFILGGIAALGLVIYFKNKK